MIGRHPDFWMPVFCALRPKAPIYKLPAYWYDRKEVEVKVKENKPMKKRKQTGHLILKVEPGSIGEELELEPGDLLLEINGNPVEDIFDYEYYVDSPSLTMLSGRPTERSGNWR